MLALQGTEWESEAQKRGASRLQRPRVTSHPGSPGTEGLLGRGGAFGAKPGNVPKRPVPVCTSRWCKRPAEAK